MKKLVLLALSASLLLTGCGTGADNSGEHAPEKHYYFWQDLPDGEKVLCVWVKDVNSGGLSCDWNGRQR